MYEKFYQEKQKFLLLWHESRQGYGHLRIKYRRGNLRSCTINFFKNIWCQLKDFDENVRRSKRKYIFSTTYTLKTSSILLRLFKVYDRFLEFKDIYLYTFLVSHNRENFTYKERNEKELETFRVNLFHLLFPGEVTRKINLSFKFKSRRLYWIYVQIRSPLYRSLKN